MVRLEFLSVRMVMSFLSLMIWQWDWIVLRSLAILVEYCMAMAMLCWYQAKSPWEKVSGTGCSLAKTFSIAKPWMWNLLETVYRSVMMTGER